MNTFKSKNANRLAAPLMKIRNCRVRNGDNDGTKHASRAVGQARHAIRTLVVDDSPIILKTLSLFLQRQQDFQLIGTAVDGYQALRRVAELKPDLVLMDFHLPGMTGLEVARRIKAFSPAPVVIMVTAEDTPECRTAAIAAGANGFAGKHHLFPHLLAELQTLFPKTCRPPQLTRLTKSHRSRSLIEAFVV
jgi:CheY-like chemotaxis protein